MNFLNDDSVWRQHLHGTTTSKMVKLKHCTCAVIQFCIKRKSTFDMRNVRMLQAIVMFQKWMQGGECSTRGWCVRACVCLSVAYILSYRKFSNIVADVMHASMMRAMVNEVRARRGLFIQNYLHECQSSIKLRLLTKWVCKPGSRITQKHVPDIDR